MASGAPNKSGIYEIVNRSTGRRYVGSATNIRVRWCVHRSLLRRALHHSFILQRSWAKHGESAFDFRVIELCAVLDLAAREQHYIDALRPAYNVSKQARGGGASLMSTEGRLAIAASNRRRAGFKMSADARARISAAKMGNTATKGTKRSPAAIERTAAAHRGLKRSAETRARISAAMAGKKRKPFSAQTLAKLSAASKGRAKSPEHMAALQEGRRNRVYTAEDRARIGEASRAAWARRKAAAAL